MLQIDIVIPVYNKEEYLSELLNLLLSRESLYDKIILVDDCSKDSSREIIKQFEESYPDKIITFFQATNQGPHFARIKGASLSDKFFLMFMDADDLIHLDGLKNFLNADIDWNKFGICFGNTVKVYNNNTENLIYMSTSNTQKITKPIDLFFVEKPTMSGIIVRKDIVELMSVGECSWGEDIIFYLKALTSTPFIYKQETVGIYRIMEGTRGTSGGTLVKRIVFIKTLYSVLTFQKVLPDLVFFVKVSVRTILAWCLKKIR